MKEPYYLICKVLVEKEKIVVLDVQASASSVEEAEKLLPQFPGCRIFHGWDVLPESKPTPVMTPKEIVEAHKRLHKVKAKGHAFIDVQPMPPGAPLIYMGDPPAAKPEPVPEAPKRRKSRLDVAKAMMPIQAMQLPAPTILEKAEKLEPKKLVRPTYWARIMPDGSLVKLGPGRRRSDWKVVEVDAATGKPLGGSP
jgi:hypothetical protein